MIYSVRFFYTEDKEAGMSQDESVVVFDREKITVKQEQSALLREGTKTVTETYDWNTFPEDVVMRVTGVEPVFKDDENGSLREIRLSVSELESGETGESGEVTNPEERTENADGFWERVEQETGITLHNNRVSLNGNKAAKANLVEFTGFMIDEGYVRKKDVPVEIGYKRYLINTEPVNKHGEPMNLSEEVRDGFYLETKFSREKIRQRIEELAEEFANVDLASQS